MWRNGIRAGFRFQSPATGVRVQLPPSARSSTVAERHTLRRDRPVPERDWGFDSPREELTGLSRAQHPPQPAGRWRRIAEPGNDRDARDDRDRDGAAGCRRPRVSTRGQSGSTPDSRPRGAIAQVVERLFRNQEVRSSTLRGSTSPSSGWARRFPVLDPPRRKPATGRRKRHTSSWSSWSARRPVKAEAAGSSPVGDARGSVA